MRAEHARLFVCPGCENELALRVDRARGESIEEGELECQRCGRRFPIRGHIPRFVPGDNYAASFGFEWNRHARTQFDSSTGRPLSEQRFFEETRWPRDMRGETILEVGSGAGRFTEPAASTGALVVSVDLSAAVEANYSSNGDRANVLIAQSSIYELPLRRDSFDRVLCIGVLQHTPDVKRAFLALPQHLKPGGSLVVDFYRHYGFWLELLRTRRWVRPWTKRMRPASLYAACRRYVNFMWPFARRITALPFGRRINRALLVADYSGLYGLDDDVLREWAILDTFDGLSPAYDAPQRLETVQEWFREAGLVDVEVAYGFNGVFGRGRRSVEEAVRV